MIDESTDIAVHKQLIIYLSYIGHEGPVVDFLCLYKLPQADADTIYATLCRQIKEYGLVVSNMVGFGSDGASVMTGCRKGVASKSKGMFIIYFNPLCSTPISTGIW